MSYSKQVFFMQVRVGQSFKRRMAASDGSRAGLLFFEKVNDNVVLPNTLITSDDYMKGKELCIEQTEVVFIDE